MSRRFVRGAPTVSNKWTSSTRGRGRGNRGRGRGRFSNLSFNRTDAPTNSNKWVRPSTKKHEVVDDNTPIIASVIKSAELSTFSADDNDNNIRDKTTNSNDSNFDDSKDEAATPAATATRTISSSTSLFNVNNPKHSLERRGRNKLVMKKSECEISSLPVEGSKVGDIVERKTENTKLLDADKRQKLAKAKEDIDMLYAPVQTNQAVELVSNVTNKPEKNHERRGRHKLVMKKDENETISKSGHSKVTNDGNKYTWKRKTNDDTTDITKKGEILHQSYKRKRPVTVQGPRRICISAPNEDERELINGANEQPQKTMTDFQYRDTSARGGRGRGRGAGKTMGLVRVKSKNPSETPICPTFSRGLPCNNPKCRLRHDVSSEASRPMCVFFQRNGMCSKGDDCPFKHVKISWDAEICPTFDRLGYCEDEGCTLRHVSSKRSKTSTSNSKRR